LDGNRTQPSFANVLSDPYLRYASTRFVLLFLFLLHHHQIRIKQRNKIKILQYIISNKSPELFVTCQVFAENKPLTLPTRTPHHWFEDELRYLIFFFFIY